MKKLFFSQAILPLFFIACFFSLIITPSKASALEDILTMTQNNGYQTSEFYKPKSSVVISADTGQILWEDNIDLQWNPASIVKLLPAYLVFEAIEKGQFTLETTITATENDQAMSQIYELSNNTIVAGVDYSVSDLLYATLVQSSNVATVMLANLVSNNDEAAFIQLMNTTAQELGMSSSIFYNCSGASSSSFNGYYNPQGIDPDADNISTARDLATLSYYLLKKYPQVLTYTSPTQTTIMENTPYAEILENHNYSLPGLPYSYEGVDGLKTGSSPTGGYNYAATAIRGDTRVIEIILGVGNWEDPEGELQRHAFGNTLLDHAFQTFEYKKLLSAGPNTIEDEEIILSQDFYGIIQKSTTPSYTLDENQLSLNNGLNTISSNIKAPTDSYQLAKKEQKITNIISETHSSIIPVILITSVASVLGLGFIYLSKPKKKNVKYRTQLSRNYFVFIIGCSLLLLSIIFVLHSILFN